MVNQPPHIERRDTGHGTLLKVSGDINETFHWHPLNDRAGGIVIIDAEHVNRITSFGVRNWVEGIRTLTSQYLAIINCRPSLVSQLNMVRGFLGPAEVVTFYLPYACNRCGNAFEVLTDVRTSRDDLLRYVLPAAACPSCQGPGTFDDLPEAYFAFLANQKPVSTPWGFDQVASGTDTGTPSLRFTKIIEGGWTGLWVEGVLDGRHQFKRVGDGLEGSLYMSLRGIGRGTRTGADQLLEFLARLTVPIVLDELPMELAAKIAKHPQVPRGVEVLRVRAHYTCPVDGRIAVSLSPTDTRGDIPCPVCGATANPAFDRSLGEAVAGLKLAAVNRELRLLLAVQAQQATRGNARLAQRLQEGATVLGRYRLLRPLGTGGMAEVFLAKQLALAGFEKLVAVKQILPHLTDDEVFVEMFLNEARISARINHPNVVQVFDIAKEEGNYFIIMEYVEGSDLNSLLKRAGQAVPCPVGVACTIAAGISQGLAAAHRLTGENGSPTPVVHRDVSPHNVLVSRNGAVKLSDFGIAKAYDTLRQTPTAVVKGKMAYLAPELIRSGSKHGSAPQVDVFATGVVLYLLLTGKHPFNRDTEVETIAALINEEPPPPSQLRREVRPELDMVVMKALAKDPELRYSTAAELARDLGVLLQSGHLKGSDLGEWIDAIERVAPSSK